MLRLLLVVAGAVAVLGVDATAALAAEESNTWPALPFTRGPGAYLSPWKILACWFLFLAWVRSTDWISTDAQAFKLKYGMWNPIAYASFLVALVLFWLLPLFPLGFALMAIAWLVPLAVYIRQRNAAVPAYDKVLTPKHLRSYSAKKLNAIGIKVEGADEDPRDAGPQVKLTALGGADERANNVNLLTARQSAGWRPARELIDDAINQRSTHIMLDYTAESVAVRYQVDGVWLDRAPMDRPTRRRPLGGIQGAGRTEHPGAPQAAVRHAGRGSRRKQDVPVQSPAKAHNPANAFSCSSRRKRSSSRRSTTSACAPRCRSSSTPCCTRTAFWCFRRCRAVA